MTMRAITAIAIALTAAVRPDASGFKVIASQDCVEQEISREELSRIFLKTTTSWNSGQPIHPVELGPGPVRQDFARLVHQRSAAAIRAYWYQQIFSGRDVPPPQKSSNEAVVSYVRSTPGAIGYVSADAPVEGVKVIHVSGIEAASQ